MSHAHPPEPGPGYRGSIGQYVGSYLSASDSLLIPKLPPEAVAADRTDLSTEVLSFAVRNDPKLRCTFRAFAKFRSEEIVAFKKKTFARLLPVEFNSERIYSLGLFSKVKLYVVPTNEELVIAQDTKLIVEELANR